MARSAPPVRGARPAHLCASLPRRPPEARFRKGHLDRCGLHRGSHRGPTAMRTASPPFGCGPSDREAGFGARGTVVVITDNLVPYPCAPWSIQGRMSTMCSRWRASATDSKIVSGTTQITRSPTSSASLSSRAIHRGDGAHDRRFSFPGGGRRHIARRHPSFWPKECERPA